MGNSLRDFTVLSGYELEDLAADLIQAELGTHVERFPPGRDGGVDLRWRSGSNVVIGQCKHYARSGFKALLRTLRTEVAKVRELEPDDYWVVTTVDLSRAEKDKIFRLFQPWMRAAQNVRGALDLGAMLVAHPEVERRHIKLLFSTGDQLSAVVHGDIVNRSTLALQNRIRRIAPTYAVTDLHRAAQRILDKHRVLVIAGPPGVGKTALALMLVAQSISQGYDAVAVSEDISEAFTMLRQDARQIFFYDDFLGDLAYGLGRKNEHRDIEDFIALISDDLTKLLVMTSREYILREARRCLDPVGRIEAQPFVLKINQPQPADAALIFYNHIWHSNLPDVARRDLAIDGWTHIAGHRAFSPRVVDWCVGPTFVRDGRGYLARVVEALDNPKYVWTASFNGLPDFDRLLLYVLSTVYGRYGTVEAIGSILKELCRETGERFTEAALIRALDVLEGTFTQIETVTRSHSGCRETVLEVRFMNPSIREFVLSRLVSEVSTCRAILRTAISLNALELLWYGNEEGIIDGFRYLHSDLHASLREEYVAAAERITDESREYYRAVLFHNVMAPDWRPDRAWLTQAMEAHVADLLASDYNDSCQPSTYDAVLADLEGTDVGSRLHACIDAKLDIEELEDDLDEWTKLAKHIMTHRENCTLYKSASIRKTFENIAEWELQEDSTAERESLTRMIAIASVIGMPDVVQRLQDRISRSLPQPIESNPQSMSALDHITWSAETVALYRSLLGDGN